MTNIINNKMKQAKAGNWGKPNKTEQKKSARLDTDDRVKFPSKKKKKKKEKKVFYLWACPFCGEEIPEKKDNKNSIYVFNREDSCKCGAIKVPDCPACHRSTWFKEGIYKHNFISCGFTGKRRETK